MGEKCESSVNNVTMAVFDASVLLMRVWTSESMSNAICLEERGKRLEFGASVSLYCFDGCGEVICDKLHKIDDSLSDLRF